MLDDATLRRLWLRMAEIYGHRWVSAYGADAGQGAGPTWAQGLAGLSTEQVGAGVRACVSSAEPWPPTLPEFRAMCLAIPAMAAVRDELAASNTRRSPFARLVWSYLDTFRWRQAPADAADRLLRDAYARAREHVMQGSALPDEPVAEIERTEPVRTPADPDVARAALAAMSEILGRPPVEPRTCTT